MSELMEAICADLAAEVAELRALLENLSEPQWDTATPAKGWTIRDQIGHLAFYDRKAVLALRNPDAFAAEISGLQNKGIDALEREHLAWGRSMTGNRLLAEWTGAHAELVSAYAQLDPKERVIWYGPPMAVRSKITARIMETWAHGQDVRDALGATAVPGGRLRHVCHIAVRARPFAFAANGLAPPEKDVRVELTAPDGEVWSWGDPAAAERVTGPALDFALLATQRRHRDDLRLTAIGESADQWLDIAQAFAGPPGPGREPGQFA